MYRVLAPGLNAYIFEALSSTMDQARFMVEEGYEEGTVVVAKQQYAGVGRLGRQWVSEPGNLYLTYIARPQTSVSKAAQVSFVACVALGDALRRFLKKKDRLEYKWPNDLMLNGKKVAGILLETVGKDPEKIDGLMIGTGVNLQSFPSGISASSTSFLQEGIDISEEMALQSVAEYFQGALEMWRRQGFAPIKNRWLKNAYGVGKTITVRQGDKIYRGQMLGIDENGALRMSSKLGAEDLITAGDVVFGNVTTVKD